MTDVLTSYMDIEQMMCNCVNHILNKYFEQDSKTKRATGSKCTKISK